MAYLESTRQWIDAHRDLALEVLRVYLGVALFAKGIAFIGQISALEEMARAGPEFGRALVAHYVIVAHIAGGLLMAIGLITRLAAAVQVPILAGAVFFVHASDGFFTNMQLELDLLVLVLLTVYAFVGGGRWSVDRWLATRA